MIVKNLFFLITLFLFLGCLCTPDDGGACSVLDGRFSCEKASVDGLGVRFVDAPQGKYYMSDVWLERDDLESDSQGEHVNCGFTKGNSPSKDAVIMFDCTPSSSGKYILHFDVNHNEPPSYQPVSGETCLKSAAQWSCSTRGHLTFTASGAISQTTTTALNSLGGLAAIPKDRESCLAAGGVWGRVGTNPREICNLPTGDAGKTCSDDVDCQGYCFAENKEDKTGKCSDWTTVLGCHYQVDDGRVIGTLCRE